MRRISLCIALLLTAALCAHGETIYSVSMSNLSQLSSSFGSPLWLAFGLTDGSGAGDSNSAVALSKFLFTCSSPFCDTGPYGPPLTIGNPTGDLSSTVVLTDSDPFTYFQQQFLVGDSLTFELQLLTLTPEAGPIPDGFAFYILDSSGAALPTLAPDGYSFLSATLDPVSPTVSPYGWSGNPSVIPTVTAVPEPAGMLVPVIVAFLALRKRHTRAGS